MKTLTRKGPRQRNTGTATSRDAAERSRGVSRVSLHHHWESSHAFISTRWEFPCFHFDQVGISMLSFRPGGNFHAFISGYRVGVRMLSFRPGGNFHAFISTRWEFPCFHFYQVGTWEAWTQNSFFNGFRPLKLVLFCSYLTFVFISSDEKKYYV